MTVSTTCNFNCKTQLVEWVRSISFRTFLMALSVTYVITNLSRTTCYGFSIVKKTPTTLPRRQLPFQTRAPTVARTYLLLHSPERSINDDDPPELNYMDDLLNRAETIQVELLLDKLEKANTQGFLKHMPKKLPYNDARRWIQANLGPNTKEEFYDLVENGNLRTPYIPKRPEEYYTRTREWISWDHFLTGLFDQEQPSAVQPPTGVFD